MKRITLLLLFVALLVSCKFDKTPKTAQEVIDRSIKTSQTYKLANAKLSFNFRDRSYTAERKNGLFELQRITKNGPEVLTDVLSNDGFQRFLNKTSIEVPDSMAVKYSESINSVHYFAVLPYGLNDKAVRKKLLPEVVIKNKAYHKIEITFAQEGGGVDFEDVFVYWINKKTYQVDYLAYSYHVNGGGKRFRQATKTHLIDGIRLADYDNYKPRDSNLDLRDMDRAFEKEELIKVSEIKLKNIIFNPIKG